MPVLEGQTSVFSVVQKALHLMASSEAWFLGMSSSLPVVFWWPFPCLQGSEGVPPLVPQGPGGPDAIPASMFINTRSWWAVDAQGHPVDLRGAPFLVSWCRFNTAHTVVLLTGIRLAIVPTGVHHAVVPRSPSFQTQWTRHGKFKAHAKQNWLVVSMLSSMAMNSKLWFWCKSGPYYTNDHHSCLDKIGVTDFTPLWRLNSTG